MAVTDRERLRELAEAATSGPWTEDGLEVFTGHPGSPLQLKVAEGYSKKEAAFIAAANPSTILALIAKAEAAERLAEELEYFVDGDFNEVLTAFREAR